MGVEWCYQLSTAASRAGAVNVNESASKLERSKSIPNERNKTMKNPQRTVRLATAGCALVIATAVGGIGLVTAQAMDRVHSDHVKSDPCDGLGVSVRLTDVCRASLAHGGRTYYVNDDGLGVQACRAVLDPQSAVGVDEWCGTSTDPGPNPN